MSDKSEALLKDKRADMMEVKDMRSAQQLTALSYDSLSEADRQHALSLLGTFYRAYNRLATRLAFANGRIEQLQEQIRESEEDKRDAAAEARWSERQGDDYGAERDRLRAALENCNEHRADPVAIIGIVDAALAGVPPYPEYDLGGKERRAAETGTVPLPELQEALSSEGHKDYRIEALEAALDWAMLAVFTHYSSGEAPAISGAFEEIEKARARFLAECKRLSLNGLESHHG